MNQTIRRVLDGKQDNYIFPFFWQHGEDHAILRNYMQVIHDANIGAVCLESRPHPDFCGPRWWADMDVILHEARKRGMKVWILDDSHFPTGFANGAMKDQPTERCRKSITCKTIDCGGKSCIRLEREELAHPEPLKKSPLELGIEQMRGERPRARTFDDDRLLGISAIRQDGETLDRRDLAGLIREGGLEWEVPTGDWKVYVLHITGNAGYHPDYISMMDAASCRVLIDAVYEPHYAHYKNDFGKTIAGFFSDEPEFGNGHLYAQDNPLGTDQDLPWSAELEERLRIAWGDSYTSLLPLLWENLSNAATRNLTAQVRYGYMDAITRLVEKDFSQQIGDWCHAHEVEYIGHIIEDNNQHTRTGSSLGHYFRSMSGQDMAGIDDIGGQVFPQGEEVNITGQISGNRNGEFYHYVLGKLASSYAALDPVKKGRAMCEIFGNYGWAEGVRLEKYLADHFMVRGVNNFVPHAFSPKAFPDPDCPPHFYAHGHNPQYRHFGALMAYMNRVCALISGGRHIAPVAVLYHGEAEWAGKYMPMEKLCHLLADAQIDYDIIPQDVFTETERYKTVPGEILRVNSQEYKILLVPYMEYITGEFAEAATALYGAGFTVVFINDRPKGICNGADNTEIPTKLTECPVVPLEGIIDFIRKKLISELVITPSNNRIRYLHYIHDGGMSLHYFVNEGTEIYRGVVTLPDSGPCAVYNAWDNKLERAEYRAVNEGGELKIVIEPLHSLIVIFDKGLSDQGLPNTLKPPFKYASTPLALNEGWNRSVCGAIEYPAFTEVREIKLPDMLASEKPDFAGFVRYERSVTFTGEQLAKPDKMIEITDAYEGVEFFVNGVSAGIQIVPPFRYCIDAFLKEGLNTFTIEVATTLERQIKPTGFAAAMEAAEPKNLLGVTGEVKLYL
jgi:hypothetical protein